MSHDPNPTSLSADAVPDELREIVSLADVLLGCEGAFFEKNGSFSATLATLVSRLRRVQVAVCNEGGKHE